MYKIVALLSLLFLVGCVSAQSVGQSWIGAPESSLLAQWGAPSRTAETGDKKIHTWERRNGYGQIICHQTMVIQNQKVVDHSSNCGVGLIQ